MRLPASLESVLVARLDRLPLAVKHVVQTAAVLGFEFERPVLMHMLHHDPDLGERLRYAADAAIWSAVGELEYVFRHNLLRDAAYTMQLQSRLRQQHRLAADAYEVLYPEGSRPFDKLAHHCEIAGDAVAWLRYLECAADAARTGYANDAAIRDYRRLLAVISDSAHQIDVSIKLAQVLTVVGQLDQVGAVLENPIELCRGLSDPRREGAALTVLGHALLRRGSFSEALAASTRAADLARSAGALQIQAEALRNLGLVHDQKAEIEDALVVLRQALAVATEAGDDATIAKVLTSLAIASWNGYDRESCQRFHQSALTIYS